MGHPAEQPRPGKQTTLQRTLTEALNELGMEAALVAIYDKADGPLVPHGSRGFAPREVQAIVRTLSGTDVTANAAPIGEGEGLRAARLRLITPAAKALLALPLRYRQRQYGILVVGRKEGAAFTKKEKSLLENAGDGITSALDRAGLFDGTVLLSPPMVAPEPAAALAAVPAAAETPQSYATPAVQERIAALLNESAAATPFDRAWVTYYDPIAGIRSMQASYPRFMVSGILSTSSRLTSNMPGSST